MVNVESIQPSDIYTRGPEYQEDFKRWEQEMVENVRGERVPRGNYDVVGTFEDWVRENLFPNETPKNMKRIIKKAWTGSIGIKEADTMRNMKISEVLQPDNLARYYVVADPNAPTRCIDGRCKTCFGTDGHDVDESLGAQVPGGSPTAALCYRVVAHDTFETNDYSINADLTVFNDSVKELGLSVGAHTGDSAEGDMTGCGALDRLPEILERVTNPAALKQVRKLAKRILGEEFYDTKMVDVIVGRLLGLRSEEERYLGKHYTGELNENDEPVFAYEYRQKALERVDQESIVELRGKHREVAMVINTVPGTTFHTDQFSEDNNEDIQVFNYDFWRSSTIAQALFPTDDMNLSLLEQQENLRRQKKYITTRAIFAIGTAMVLTDGSIDLIIRSRQEEELPKEFQDELPLGHWAVTHSQNTR